MEATANKDMNGVSRSRPRPILMIPLRRCGSHALRLRLKATLNKLFFLPANPHGALGISEIGYLFSE